MNWEEAKPLKLWGISRSKIFRLFTGSAEISAPAPTDSGNESEARMEKFITLPRCTMSESATVSSVHQGCQIAKFDPFLSLDCARVEGVGAQSKERKGSNFAA